ncbi:MAG: hypothetical protein AB7H97_13310 [Pseudobdellovibrionaceae bacterium]
MNSKAKHFDKRVSDRYIEKGQLKESDIDSHLKQLPDDSANAEWVQLDMEESDIGDADSDAEESVEE